ncbi:MBL fold metallo-hydrolase [Oceanibacterium hippocampi]|uniref:Ribonuclease Z n=1 Tax=Oceanibacterium hippocampi TaxID=745714 RepID=A0A1Y5SSV7_9PROT|nr:MBL fold metallo-hydrolase [Oceanibacterium hippocampi]SLN47011.1 Ribonuclease Z [Oceanibacterium hippocampi]
MQVHFIGSGDAFGSGGRFNTCFHLSGREANFLIDCGASSLIALRQQQIDLNAIQSILVTHFHADHFGGLPFFMLDAQFHSRRTAPLTVAGPAGIEDRYRQLTELMFPGSSATTPRFPLHFIELVAGAGQQVGALEVDAFEVNHGNAGGPFHGYRVTVEGRTIAYTGDTEWTDSLVDLARDTDLFIAEAYFHEKRVKLHLDHASLTANLGRLEARRIVLTHMSPDMIGRPLAPPFEAARDGLRIAL